MLTTEECLLSSHQQRNPPFDRADYERVNGYDENFVGWGCEDDDLRLRLRHAGVRIESILFHR